MKHGVANDCVSSCSFPKDTYVRYEMYDREQFAKERKHKREREIERKKRKVIQREKGNQFRNVFMSLRSCEGGEARRDDAK